MECGVLALTHLLTSAGECVCYIYIFIYMYTHIHIYKYAYICGIW